jgi:SAM-dependent methyltransferase
VVDRFRLGDQSLVVELAANDGYLLQYVAARKIRCIGIEPTASTAAAARKKGIEIVEKFFGLSLAHEMSAHGQSADLIVANNVLAHVPDINDFVSGIAALLKPNGVATFEFPHFLNLVAHNQFDTIYHEKNGLSVFDVEELSTHGGSLRVYAQRKDGLQACIGAVEELVRREQAAGLLAPTYYAGFQARADKVKNDFLSFLLDAKRSGKKVGAYGAAAKGNTLMNYAGIRPDLLPYVVDKNPSKQGKFLPGTRIPIVSDDSIRRERPDYVVVLPWNIREEVMLDLAYVREWGGRFVTAIPQLREA